MKYLSVILITLCICLAGCSKNEPPTEVRLTIREQFIPENLKFSTADNELKEKIKPWSNKEMVVNSTDEIPEDPIGFAESFYKINFSNNTLLLCYFVHDYNVVSVNNYYYKNTIEKTFNWSINLGISGRLNEDDIIEDAYLSRYAILVPKIPSDSKVIIWHGLTDHNWDWDE